MRRHELDWLRVLAFGLLIFYHVGMFFVPWNWHIKNNETSTWMVYPMLFVNQWRLHLLFVISGMGTSFALTRRDGWQYVRERTKRLLLPLLFGVLVIVPPQVYLERVVYEGYQRSYLDFIAGDAFSGIYPQGNFSWHHLWFLPYLLFFSILLAPVFISIKNNPRSQWIMRLRNLMNHPAGLFVFVIPLLLWEVLLRPRFPQTNAFWGDWYNLASYLTLFFMGYLLITVAENFWENVRRYRNIYLFTGIISFTVFLTLHQHALPAELSIFKPAVKVINQWAWILALFGLSTVYLNRPGRFISYATKAVFPFYILHQTVTVFLGFYVYDLEWNMAVKFVVLAAGTFLICLLIYELLIKRAGLPGIILGHSPKK